MPGAILGAYRAPSGALSWRVTANAVTETVTAIVTSGREYWTAGDGIVDSADGDGDLLALFRNALLTHSAIGSVGVTFEQGRIRITADVPVSILWTDAATTAEAWVWGWPGTADSASGTVVDAPNACPLCWLASEEISLDSRPRDVLNRGFRSAWGGRVYTSDYGDAAQRRTVSFLFVPQTLALEEYAGADYAAFESILRRSLSKGRRFRLYEDQTTITSGTGFASYRAETLPRLERNAQWSFTWDVLIQARAEGLDTTASGSQLWNTSTGAYVRVSPGNYLLVTDPTTFNGRAALTAAWWARSVAPPARGIWFGRGTQFQAEERGDPSWVFFAGGGGQIEELTTGVWAHYVAVFNAGALALYVNGQPVASSAIGGAAPAALSSINQDLTIGGVNTGSSAAATTVDLARLAFYPAAANAAQAAELFNARGDLAAEAVGLGVPLIALTLADAQVQGSVGGVASIVGAPTFVAGG